jgi:hypothetical protein
VLAGLWIKFRRRRFIRLFYVHGCEKFRKISQGVAIVDEVGSKRLMVEITLSWKFGHRCTE